MIQKVLDKIVMEGELMQLQSPSSPASPPPPEEPLARAPRAAPLALPSTPETSLVNFPGGGMWSDYWTFKPRLGDVVDIASQSISDSEAEQPSPQNEGPPQDPQLVSDSEAEQSTPQRQGLLSDPLLKAALATAPLNHAHAAITASVRSPGQPASNRRPTRSALPKAAPPKASGRPTQSGAERKRAHSKAYHAAYASAKREGLSLDAAKEPIYFSITVLTQVHSSIAFNEWHSSYVQHHHSKMYHRQERARKAAKLALQELA